MSRIFISGKLCRGFVDTSRHSSIGVSTRGINTSRPCAAGILSPPPKLNLLRKYIPIFLPFKDSAFDSAQIHNKKCTSSLQIICEPKRNFHHSNVGQNPLLERPENRATYRHWKRSRTPQGSVLSSSRRCLSSLSSAGDNLPPLRSVEDVAEYITGTASSVLVMAGAGISTASGIPDFRSPGTGLYHNLQKYNLPYPEAIFDINYFIMDPRPFVSLAQELYPGVKYLPNAAHWFLRLLQQHGKLRRVYTQNIDGLERQTGLLPPELMEAHGSFSSASCTLCGAAHPAEEVKDSILHRNGVPQCCKGGCKGKVKPDIVFFGENLPNEFWQFEDDLHAVDLVLIMGTSLEVHPFANIAEQARSVTPRVLINRGRAGSLGSRPRDCLLLGDIVDTVTALAAACGWEQDLQQLMNA